MLIENFSVVDAVVGVYRGRQPFNLDEWTELTKLAIPVKQSIKLDRETPAESDKLATDLGIEVMYAPEPFLQQLLTEPSIEDIEACIAFLIPGTYIHCLHGEDRTGLVVAAYRIIKCGWTRQHAWAEMISHKFHPVLFGLVRAFNDLADKYKA